MNTGSELKTFITSLNGGMPIDETLLTVLVDTAKAILEEERPWMVLRKVNTSLSASTANTWQTEIDLSSITDFSRFYGEYPVRLFDGVNRIERYKIVPLDRRLEYKDISNTAVFDENAKKLYLNGIVPFSGTLYISYLMTTDDINLSSESAIWTQFPQRFLPILGFYSIGIHKGAVDYDSINKEMLPGNQAALSALKMAFEKWDNEKAASIVDSNDPTALYGWPRAGAVNTYEIE